jgi:hypothetical protein
MMLITTILIFAVSLALQLPACMTIHNECSSIELASPVYFGNGAVCPKLSNRQIDIGTKKKACFEINATQDEFEGALLYKLRRSLRDQYNMDTLTTEANKSETTYVYMLVAWKVKHSKSFVHVTLIEHTKKFTWNEERLKKLYYRNRSRLKKQVGTALNIWFINDNMVLKIAFRIRDLKRTPGLNISISDEEKDDCIIRPLCVDLKRWVILEISKFFVLICVVSLILQPPVTLNIYNQYRDINLTSPFYFNFDREWRATLREEENVNVMRNPKSNSEQEILKEALIYRIQWREQTRFDESVQDKLKHIQFLIVCCVERATKPYIYIHC